MKNSRKITFFRNGRIQQQVLPMLVWVVAVAGVGVLFYGGSQKIEIVGMAQSQVAQVCAPVDGHIKTVYVRLFDVVKKGQPVASLDDELLTAQMATVSATAEHLRSQLIPTQDQLLSDINAAELDRAEEQRRFAVDVEKARLDILSLKAQIASDRITLEDYAAEVKILTDLLAKNTVAPYEVDKAKALHTALARKIEEMENHVVQAQEQLKLAQLRYDTFISQKFQVPSVDAALDAIRKEAAVQEKLVEEFAVQRRALVLTAPIDGTVVQILAKSTDPAAQRTAQGILEPGENVVAGQPILVIAQNKSQEIIAYAGQNQIGDIAVGMKVALIRNGGVSSQIAKSEILSVGPIIEQMPARLWVNPAVPQWGLPFVIKIPEGMQLTPGETVGIRQL